MPPKEVKVGQTLEIGNRLQPGTAYIYSWYNTNQLSPLSLEAVILKLIKSLHK